LPPQKQVLEIEGRVVLISLKIVEMSDGFILTSLMF
jgi:hypothetical protein